MIRIGHRYELRAPIGVGGMGEVHQAYDRLTGQTVALKRVLVNPQSLQFQSQQASLGLEIALAREFQILAGLRHPNIISVLDYGFDGQQPYFTMTLLENAVSLLRASRLQEPRKKVGMLIQMLQALAYLHRRGIVHRDLKPHNVLVQNDVVKVLDFGLAIDPASAQEVEGTLAYMAPEVLQGEAASPASDLYAVGVMAYEMLTGHHPFNTEQDSYRLMLEIIGTPADFTGLDNLFTPEFTAIIAKLMAKEPAERYTDAFAVIEAICAALDLPLPADQGAIRESYLQAARFVGRKTEMQTLSDALDQLQAGQASAWLIGGESGVGKTRLLTELRTYGLVKGALVVEGQAVEGGGLPFQLWRTIARKLVLNAELDDLAAGVLKEIIPDIDLLLQRTIAPAPPLSQNAARERLITTLVELIPTTPVLIIVEDLQWANESLGVLKLLLKRRLPVMIVGSVRLDEAPTLPDDLPQMQLLKLERLGENAIAELCQFMIGTTSPELLALITKETEGNTFFIVEVMRALAQQAGQMSDIGEQTLPESVVAGGIEALLQRKLARIPAWGQTGLHLAAVSGRYLDTHVLAPLIPNFEAWLEVCAAYAILETYDQRWQFAHDKLRQKVLQGLSDEERRARHRQVAEQIEALYPHSTDQAEILLGHWVQAGDIAKELMYIIPACDHWIHFSADYQRAIQHLERGIAQTTDDPQQVEFLLLLSNAQRLSGSLLLAERSLKQALVIAKEHQLSYAIGRCYYNMGVIAENHGEYLEAQAHLEQASTIQQRLSDVESFARTLQNLGSVEMRLGNFAKAINYFDRAGIFARDLNSSRLLASLYNNLGVLYHSQGDYERATQSFQSGLQLSRALGDVDGMGIHLNNLGEVTRDPQTARAYFEESLAIFQRTGDQRSMGYSLRNLGNVATLQHDYAAAQSYYEQSLYVRRTITDYHGLLETLGSLSFLATRQHDIPTATHYLREALRFSEQVGSDPLNLFLLAIGVQLACLREDFARAAQYYALVTRHPSTEQSTRDLLATLQPLEIAHEMPEIAASLADLQAWL